MKKIKFRSAAKLFLCGLITALLTSPAIAATFSVTDKASLRAAVATSASNSQDDVIDLGGNTIILTSDPANNTGGELLLANDSSFSLEIQNGTIQRDSGAGLFRLINIPAAGNPGQVIFRDLTLQDGRLGIGATAANTDGGGAVFTQRPLQIINSTFVDNAVVGNGNGGAILSTASLDIVHSQWC